MEFLSEKLDRSVNYYDYEVNYDDKAFNYLALGNSLTLIKSWGRGICSTQPDNDYFHIVCNYLQQQNQSVIAYPYNFSHWERSSNRSSTLSDIDIYLSEKLDLITIQLGENCASTSTYESDLEELVRYVSTKCPKATVVLIGAFWSESQNDLRKQAAQATNIRFADLSEIIGNPDYQSKQGTVCYLSDGSTIEVSQNAATHPGDSGMQYIADSVISVLQK